MSKGNRQPYFAVSLLVCVACSRPVEVEHRWSVLGAEATATIWATNAVVAREIADEVALATARVEAFADTRDAESVIGRLNRQAADGPFLIEENDLFVCIKRAIDYARVSDGAFDPTRGPLVEAYRDAASVAEGPTDAVLEEALGRVDWREVRLMPEAHAVRFGRPGMRLDLGGMVDGLALDLAMRAFSRVGSRAGLLRLRGSVQAWGRPPGEADWNVPLVDPRRRDASLGFVRVDNRALGLAAAPREIAELDTSRVRWVLDPRTGRPPESDVRVAVAIAEGGADATALAEALLVAGTLQAGAILAKTHRVEAILLGDGDGEPLVLASASLRDRLLLSDDVAREVGGRVRFILPPESVALPRFR